MKLRIARPRAFVARGGAIPTKDLEFRRFRKGTLRIFIGSFHAPSSSSLGTLVQEPPCLMRLLRLHRTCIATTRLISSPGDPLLKSLVDSPEVEEWLTRKSNRWNHGKDLSPIVLRAAAEYIMERDAARLGKRIVGDKSPSSTHTRGIGA